jgi:hypothetical protein
MVCCWVVLTVSSTGRWHCSCWPRCEILARQWAEQFNWRFGVGASVRLPLAGLLVCNTEVGGFTQCVVLKQLCFAVTSQSVPCSMNIEIMVRSNPMLDNPGRRLCVPVTSGCVAVSLQLACSAAPPVLWGWHSRRAEARFQHCRLSTTTTPLKYKSVDAITKHHTSMHIKCASLAGSHAIVALPRILRMPCCSHFHLKFNSRLTDLSSAVCTFSCSNFQGLPANDLVAATSFASYDAAANGLKADGHLWKNRMKQPKLCSVAGRTRLLNPRVV